METEPLTLASVGAVAGEVGITGTVDAHGDLVFTGPLGRLRRVCFGLGLSPDEVRPHFQGTRQAYRDIGGRLVGELATELSPPSSRLTFTLLGRS